MIVEWMQTFEGDTLQTISERAMLIASDTGRPRRFEFDRKVYQADPAPPGIGVITEVLMFGAGLSAQDWPAEYQQSIDYIGLCSKDVTKNWTIAHIVLSFLKGKQVLVAGRQSVWLSVIRREVCEQTAEKLVIAMQSRDASKYLMVTQRSVELDRAIGSNFKGRVLFETYQNPMNSFFGRTFDVAYIEENQEEVMGGNYNDFPYRSTTPEQERWREKQMRESRRQERDNQISNLLEERGKRTAMAVEQMRQQAMEQIKLAATPPMLKKPRTKRESLDDMILYPGAIVGVDVESDSDDMVEATMYSTYGGISRNPESKTFEERLQVVRDVLLKHLRYQMNIAPSMDAIYANDDVGIIRARDILRVVDALDPMVQAEGETLWLPEQFVAKSDDGSKVVLSGDNKIDTGVIYDPNNRPVRKFRLEEEIA